jgi:hypothetical protein
LIAQDEIRYLFHSVGGMFDSALPYDQDPPSKTCKKTPLVFIPLNVSTQFLMPEVSASCRRGYVEAAWMPVPEAAMNENGHAILAQYQIRGAGEILSV